MFYSSCPCFVDSFLITSEGKVVKLRQESIHVIVLGFASAVITYEDIRDEFKHRTVCFVHCTCEFLPFPLIHRSEGSFHYLVLIVLCIDSDLETWRRNVCQQSSQAPCNKGWDNDTIFGEEVRFFPLIMLIP